MVFKSSLPNVKIPEHISLPDFVFRDVDKRLSKPYIIDSRTGVTITYRQVRDLSHNVAGNLSKHYDFKQGQVLGILLPNCPYYPIIFHGVATAGGASTTINPIYTTEEVTKQLIDSGAVLLVTMSMFLPKAREAVKGTQVTKIFVIADDMKSHVAEEGNIYEFRKLLGQNRRPKVKINPKVDLVSIPYSSGTTGASKGVMLTHYNQIANLIQIDSLKAAEENDILLGALPFFHIYGQVVIMNQCLNLGATIITVPQFDFAEFLQIVPKYKISICHLVPPVIIQLAKNPVILKADLSTIRRIFSGAAPLGAQIIDLLKVRFPKLDVVQGFGMTETSTVVSCELPFKGKPGSAGVLIPNVQMRVVDVSDGKTDKGIGEEGELIFKAPSNMKGYLRNEEATKNTIDAEGWLHTGDIGYIDKDGYIFIVDRLKELIKYKGFQVPPAELEALLLKHEGVADCAVIGVPDESAGELPKAFVVKKQGHENITEKELIEYVENHVSPQKRIRMVEFIDAIPKSATGKILRRMLKEPRQLPSKL
jgi:acyl-CoA synthetase (AMP-forming)/AMP-acid ligase II